MPLLRRNKRAHKNDFGHLLVVAGSPAMLGAASLVSLSAMRAGAGLVTAAIPSTLNLALQKKISNAVMTMPVAGSKGDVFGLTSFRQIRKHWSKFTSVAMGPGLGTSFFVKAFVRAMAFQCPLPMVIDADALNALSGSLEILKSCRSARVLTPHPGEFFRLSGNKPLTERERRKAAKDFAVENNVVLVLKGHRTVVASPDGKVFVNMTGNPGMAKAGTGDVLTGIIAGFLAQGIPSYDAAKEAVYRHGMAGDILLKQRKIYSFTADDLIDSFSRK
ncbi:MAG: NAD(P)H-hydrate dehydratase [Candidatus Omnitrophica bacterium]|nr:NAD(P)H-hydrate dehydratase [Candidatus Omnitrophota bacterium]